ETRISFTSFDRPRPAFHCLGMVGRRCIVWAWLGLGCGEEPGVAMGPAGAAGEPPPGSGGSAEMVIESLESDTISVRDGEFVEGEAPASADMALPQILSLTGPPAAT